MSRRMTVVFDDEELYTALKVEAARTHRPAKDIVADALYLIFAVTPDEQRIILRRARANASPAPDSTSVDELLEELGLAKSAQEAHVP